MVGTAHNGQDVKLVYVRVSMVCHHLMFHQV